jgi:hypothetical protein
MTAQLDYLTNPEVPSDPEIVRLEDALRPLREIDVTGHLEFHYRPLLVPRGTESVSRRRLLVRPSTWPVVAAAAILLLIGAVETFGSAMRPWTVVDLPGGAHATTGIPKTRKVETGDWIITDSVSSARLNVGVVGRTDIRPGSRVRIVATTTSQHRLALDQGELHARIWAPPKFFLVETKNALAVDLGCEYTLRASSDGSVWLSVESGEVELVSARSLIRVPAGNSATINADGTSGIPVPWTASDALIAALSSFEKFRDEVSLDRVLTLTDSSSTIVLWHLLPQVDESARGKVFDKLATVTLVPRGLTREKIVRLDWEALQNLRTFLAPAWSTEEVPLWKRWWRTAWSLVRG